MCTWTCIKEIYYHRHHQACVIHQFNQHQIPSIISAHDPIQNPGQTWIFYKPAETHLTQTKHDPVDNPR